MELSLNSVNEMMTSVGGSAGGLITFLVVILLLFRIYSLLRVVKDISRRTDHLGFQLFSILLILILTPFLGLPIYFLVRPMQRKDISYRLRQDLLAVESTTCQACGQRNAKSHEFCAVCWEKLKKQCEACQKHYPRDYEHCPFCGIDNDAVLA